MSAFDRLAMLAESASRRIGDALSWLLLAVSAAAVAMLLLRHLLASGDVGLPPAYVWCTALVMMAGGGMALKGQADDVLLFRYLKPAAQAWLMILGALLILLPWAIMLDLFAGSLSLLAPSLIGEASGTLESVWWRLCVDAGALTLALEGVGLCAHALAALSSERKGVAR